MTKPKRSAPKPIYVRPTAELRKALDAQTKAERRTVQAVVEAALWAYLRQEARP